MEDVDVVIIGSGYGGSVPAARLAQAGLRVVVLERGPRLFARDLRQSDDLRYVQGMTDVVQASDNVIFRTGRLVGGASIPMDGAHFRIPRHSFEARDPVGRRYWPEAFSPSALEPYWLRAEEMFHVRQFAWNEIPKAGGLFARMLDLAGASCERARLNYADCLQCGFCAQGCIFEKKHNLLQTYIPLAERSGAEFRAGCTAQRIEPVGTRWRVAYTRDGAQREITGQRLFVAGGGIHTPALLLRSRAALPSLNTHVGEHFNHNGEMQYVGVLPAGFEGTQAYSCFKGMDNAGVMSFHWYESHGFTLHPGGGLEPGIFSAAVAGLPSLPRRAWGMEYKRFVESVYPRRIIGFSSLGLSESHSAVTLRSDGTPDVVVRDPSAYNAFLDRMEGALTEVSRVSGVTIVPAYPRRYSGMTSAHLLASCRMSDRREDGVVDSDCRVWGYENLYICDASSIPFSMAVNPALNITAVAERAVERALQRG